MTKETLHPDDAKDKVFRAILKALERMGNIPSSPKELANTIIKHNYATLGGQTPFATVSSRISQHFKRAAEHVPPRAPLLIKHVDQHHSRKIHYSLTKEQPNSSLTEEQQEIAAAIAMTKLSQQPTHVEEEKDTQIKKEQAYWTPFSLEQDPVDSSSEKIPTKETCSNHHTKFKGHTFTITKQKIQDVECFELNSPDDIPNTTVLRYIHSSNSTHAFTSGYVNASQLRKAAIPVLGIGELDLEEEKKTSNNLVYISHGALEGIWVPLKRARELVEEFEIESSPGLTKLLSQDPLDQILDEETESTAIPDKKQTTTQDLLESMNIQNLNLSAIQHMIATIPNLSQLSPPHLYFTKQLQDYLHTMTTQNNKAIASSSEPVYKKPQKILPQPPKPALVSSPPSPVSLPSELIIYPITPTEPSMFITLVDHIAVCTAILKKEEDQSEYRVMRRLDNGFINGTQLLTAGGIETESERSMILSFEMSRVRIPNKSSGLFGTWIPSRRALELAATCSIQHRLGPFLEDDIEPLFPSPLPISTTMKKKRSNSATSSNSNSNHHLAAITLAALRNPPPPVRRELPTNNAPLLTHPNNTLKTSSTLPQAPLLGKFLDTDGNKNIIIIEKPVNNAIPMITTETETNEDIDIEGEDSLLFLQLESEDEETDTDYNVEQVRKKMRNIRDAAIAAMEMEIHPIHDIFQPKQQKRYKRKSKKKSTSQDATESESEEEESIQHHFTSHKNHTRKRPGAGGKWSASSVGKLAPTAIKRSATWSSTMDSPTLKRQKHLKPIDLTPPVVTKKTTPTKKKAPLVTHTIVNEEDEDEDVDIGGSDDDDDIR